MPLRWVGPTEPEPANDDHRPTEPAPSPDGRRLLRGYRLELSFGRERAVAYWTGLSEEQRAAALAAAEEERRARAEGRDPESLHAGVAGLLAEAAGPAAGGRP